MVAGRNAADSGAIQLDMGAYWAVPQLWPGRTVVVIGGGPSLTAEDVEHCHGKAPVIAINDAYRLAGWCTWLHACDSKWWRWHASQGALDIDCIRTTIDPLVPPAWAHLLQNTGTYGFDPRPWCLCTGNSSGYQGVCIAMHGGATRIVLLGFDYAPDDDGKEHWFGAHPETYPVDYAAMRDSFELLAPSIEERSIEVVNCTPGSALETFPMADIREVL